VPVKVAPRRERKRNNRCISDLKFKKEETKLGSISSTWLNLIV